jgi:spermidine/putrescine transport system permease protein
MAASAACYIGSMQADAQPQQSIEPAPVPHRAAQSGKLLILLPAGLWLVLFMLVPVVIIGVFSFGSRDALGQIHVAFQPDNYLRFVEGPYLLCLWRSLGMAAGTTALCLLLGFPCAAWLAFQVPPKQQGLFITLLTVPLWISFLLRIYAWITILRPTGLLPSFLRSLGWVNPPDLLYNQQAILLGMLYNYLPYMILPLYSTLEKLDRRLLEASRDLGANSWTTFARITVPLSMRGIVAGIIMVFVPSMGDYVTPDLMGGAKTMYIGSLIQNQFLIVHDWAFGSAVSTILLLLVGFGIWIYLRYGETEAVSH